MNQQTDRKLLLRVVLKLMFLVSFLLVIFVLFRFSFKASDSRENIIFDLSGLAAGEHEILGSNNSSVLILHRTKAMLESIKSDHQANPFLVVYAQSPDYSCPIVMIQPDNKGQGGLKAICSGTLFDYAGRLLPDQNARFDLKEPNYSIEANILTIGLQ